MVVLRLLLLLSSLLIVWYSCSAAALCSRAGARGRHCRRLYTQNGSAFVRAVCRSTGRPSPGVTVVTVFAACGTLAGSEASCWGAWGGVAMVPRAAGAAGAPGVAFSWAARSSAPVAPGLAPTAALFAAGPSGPGGAPGVAPPPSAALPALQGPLPPARARSSLATLRTDDMKYDACMLHSRADGESQLDIATV